MKMATITLWKFIIVFIIILILSPPSAYAENYYLKICSFSNSLSASQTSSYKITISTGETIIGSIQDSNYTARLGLIYLFFVPRIVVTSIWDGFVTSQSEITITYTVDGIVKTKSFALKEGNNTLSIEESGTSITINVILDTMPPKIILETPRDNEYIVGIP